MHRLLTGYARFRKEVFPAQKEFFADLSRGQTPDALFIACADSRVVPNLITQTDPGELFVVRNVGNMVPAYSDFHGGVTSSIEFAVLGLGVKNIIVLGHSDCGAMKALLHPEKTTSMKAVSDWLRHGQAAYQVVMENRSEEKLLRAVTEENVILQLDHLRTHPSVASRLRKGSLTLHGWIYDIAEGKLAAWDPEEKLFRPLGESGLSIAPAKIAQTVWNHVHAPVPD
jgi:carbonic anhydrase